MGSNGNRVAFRDSRGSLAPSPFFDITEVTSAEFALQLVRPFSIE
jgi:hypothetical protein